MVETAARPSVVEGDAGQEAAQFQTVPSLYTLKKESSQCFLPMWVDGGEGRFRNTHKGKMVDR